MAAGRVLRHGGAFRVALTCALLLTVGATYTAVSSQQAAKTVIVAFQKVCGAARRGCPVPQLAA